MEEEMLILQNEAGKCEEDVYLLLHYICITFTTAQTGFFFIYLLVRYQNISCITYALLRIKQTTNLRSVKVHYYVSFTICVVLGHISDSDVGQLQTEDARNKWGKQFAESFLEEPLRVLF